MPDTVKKYLLSDFEHNQEKRPMQLQQEAFSWLPECTTVQDVKDMYPDEALFKDLRTLSDIHPRIGYLNEIKYDKKMPIIRTGTEILKSGEDLTLYLLRKIYLEGKELEEINHDFKKAIQNKEFKVYYQPKITISDGNYKLSSAEALVRWIHPELGFISPGMFIPLFEENGNIKILDQYVWNEAARQIREWYDKYNILLPISVNVSRIDMFDNKIVDVISSIVKNNNISPKDLFLEITESAYNNETDQIIDIINKLRYLGFKIEIDDFGSGYSSLNTLATLSFDYLKLDMKFVHDMFKNDKTLKMVGIVSDIASYLNVKLIAEGVETNEQLDKLKELNYDVIQGYYFSKPVTNIDFEEFFRRDFNKC